MVALGGNHTCSYSKLNGMISMDNAGGGETRIASFFS